MDKKIGVGQPKRIENAKILVANTAMDTDKVKIYGARVRVDGVAKVAQLEAAEKEKMKAKVNKIVKHGISCFVNRCAHSLCLLLSCPPWTAPANPCLWLCLLQAADLQLP